MKRRKAPSHAPFVQLCASLLDVYALDARGRVWRLVKDARTERDLKRLFEAFLRKEFCASFERHDVSVLDVTVDAQGHPDYKRRRL
jgi:hypothetical protein